MVGMVLEKIVSAAAFFVFFDKPAWLDQIVQVMATTNYENNL